MEQTFYTGRSHEAARDHEWLLNDFAAATVQGRCLATYAKSTDRFGVDRPKDFMARTDAHPAAVEDRLQRIEGPAARAARSLVARVLQEPPGIARVTTHDEPGPVAPTDGGSREGFRLLVAHRGVAVTVGQRRALGRFLTLMFMRSPKVERTIKLIGDTYFDEARMAMRRAGLGGSLLAASEAEVRSVSDGAAIRALGHVGQVGTFIGDLRWWVIRAGPNERFVLGDSPTCAAVALGGGAEFLPLLGPSTFVVTMPLHPEVALLATSLPVLPMAGPNDDLVAAVNRVSWRWAEEYVVGADAADLEAVRRTFDAVARRRVIPVPFDEDLLRFTAASDVATQLAQAQWRPVPDACVRRRRWNLDSLLERPRPAA